MAQQRAFLKSLRGKVTTQMLLVSLVPIVIIGALVYTSMTRAENSASDSVDKSRETLAKDTIGAGKASQAWGLAVDIETWVAERIGEVKAWGGNVAVRDAALNGEDDKDAAWSFLGDQITRSPFFEDAVVIGSSGTEATRHASWKPININSEKPSWQLAWENGLYVSDIAFISDGVTPLYYLDIAVKIEDPMSKEGLGVVVGTMKLNPQSLGPEYASKVQGNRVMVLDRSGRIITDSGNLQRFLEDKPSWAQDEQMVKNRVTNDTKGIAPGYVITDEAVAGYARATNNDVGIRVTGFEGLGWTVMVEQDAKSAFAALDSLEKLKDDLSKNTSNMLITLVVILIVVLIGAPGVAFYLSRGITKPIAQLNDAAEKVSMGDMGVTVDVKSDDEIGDLAKSFGRMIVAVRFLASDQDEEQK